MDQINQIPLTLGLLIALIVIVFSVGGFVWTIATIRKSDKEEITKSFNSALNRLEEKVDTNNNEQHSRINRLNDELSETSSRANATDSAFNTFKEFFYNTRKDGQQ